MNFLNLCIVEGNLTKDAEVRVASENKVTCFSIACNESYRGKDAAVVKQVSFFQVEIWGENIANKIAPFLKKGQGVRVTGKLKQDSWISEDGQRKEKIFIRASSLEFISNLRPLKDRENSPKKEEEVLDDFEVYDESDEILDSVEEEIVKEKKGGKKKRVS